MLRANAPAYWQARGRADVRAASASFFNPGEKLFRLTDGPTKLRLLAATGLDGAIVLTFGAALANLTAEEFVQRILVNRFAVTGR